MGYREDMLSGLQEIDEALDRARNRCREAQQRRRRRRREGVRVRGALVIDLRFLNQNPAVTELYGGGRKRNDGRQGYGEGNALPGGQFGTGGY